MDLLRDTQTLGSLPRNSGARRQRGLPQASLGWLIVVYFMENPKKTWRAGGSPIPAINGTILGYLILGNIGDLDPPGI